MRAGRPLSTASARGHRAFDRRRGVTAGTGVLALQGSGWVRPAWSRVLPGGRNRGPNRPDCRWGQFNGGFGADEDADLSRLMIISDHAVGFGSGEVEHDSRSFFRTQRDTHAADDATALHHGCGLDFVSHSREVEIDPRWVRQRFGQWKRKGTVGVDNHSSDAAVLNDLNRPDDGARGLLSCTRGRQSREHDDHEIRTAFGSHSVCTR